MKLQLEQGGEVENEKNEKIEYKRVIAYIRKSSEDNKDGEAHKQLNSIEYQRQFVVDAVKRYDLNPVIKTFEDNKTGYKAYVRDGFKEMMDYLEDHAGEIDGIVCTEISRLARNFGDGGKILWALQDGLIKRIYTASKEFTNSSADQLMVAIEFAMSKKSSDETGYRTKAGMNLKEEVTGHPARPPVLGYKSVGPRGRKKWFISKKTGPKVVDVFKQFATGKYTFEQIADYAFQIGMTSPKKSNYGKKISKNTWRNRLFDKQYIGIYEHKGEPTKGKYKPLIDIALFKQVQSVLSGNEHPKVNAIEYAYSNGLIKCGLCGDMLSGTNKKGITYYRCGKKKEPCKHMKKWKYLPEPLVEDRIIGEFTKIEIDHETWEAAKAYAIECNQPERARINRKIRELEDRKSAEISRQIEIGNKYVQKEISKEEHDLLLEASRATEVSIRTTLIKCDNILHELDELMNGFLDSVKYVSERLKTALPYNKRETMEIFCENIVWTGEKLVWDWKKPYYLFAKNAKSSSVLPR